MSMRPYYPPCACDAPGSATADQLEQLEALLGQLEIPRELLEVLIADTYAARRVPPRERYDPDNLSRRGAGLALEVLYKRRASNPGAQIAHAET